MKSSYHNLTGLLLSKCRGKKFVIALFAVTGLIFSIVTCTEDSETLPRLNTLEAINTDITSTTATLKGEFLSLGNMKIEEYGIEYSKSMIFTLSQTKGITTTPLTGVFQVDIINLEPLTKYYYRAYALVNTANVYSNNFANFTTK
jgi:hypothetical protein